MRRPQFSLRTIFWLTLVAASFFAGLKFGVMRGRWLEQLARERLDQTIEDMPIISLPTAEDWEELERRRRIWAENSKRAAAKRSGTPLENPARDGH